MSRHLVNKAAGTPPKRPLFPSVNIVDPFSPPDRIPILRAPPRKKPRVLPIRVFERPTTYSPPAPPISPLADPDVFKPYHLKHPKSAPLAGPELSAREWALSLNPYAAILASPVRMDADHHRRLPRSLLTCFLLRRAPDGSTHLLPSFDVTPTKSHPAAAYALGTYAAIKSMSPGSGRGGKLYGKLVPEKMRSAIMRDIVWRPEMADFVVAKLRRRVLDETVKVATSEGVDRIVGGEKAWARAGEVLAVMDFRGTEKEEGYEDQDRIVNILGGKWKEREAPPRMEGGIAWVNGKRVVCHDVGAMLGEEGRVELMKAWGIERGHEVVGVMMTMRTTRLLTWWMKLRGFLGVWYAPGTQDR